MLHNIIHITIFLLLCILGDAHARKTKIRHMCPIGFNLAYNRHKIDEPVCYRRKGPELFTDKFKDCAGNLYTSKLYHSLNFTEPNLVLWTDYKSLYPGGPFIDWSYTESTGDILVTTYDVKYDPSFGLDEELCVVIDPISNFTATRCNEKHYRYCFVKPYHREQDDMDHDGCKDIRGYWRFWGPKPTCLAPVTGVGGGTVRANWRQAKELCAKRAGSLLSKGWRYGNNPFLQNSGSEPTYPLGMVLNADHTSLRFDTANDNALIPPLEWNFEDRNVSTDTYLGALRDNFWYLVNSSYVFFDVVCERPIQLRSVSLNVSVNTEGKLILTANDTVDESDIYCFSDSVIYFPSQVKVRYDDDANIYVLKPITDGYYWCIHVDSKNFYVSESNKALFIREKQSLINYYAIKIRLQTEYKMENLEQFYRDWQKKLEEYIFYRTKYVKVYGELELTDPSTTEETLKRFKASYPGLKWKDRDLIHKIKIKRLYLDRKTALIHVQLNPEMIPVAPGFWDDLEVEFMKPIYYCKGVDTLPTLSLGDSTTSAGCRNYTCVGDFNEGVQWVIRAADGCSSTPAVQLSSAVRVSNEVTHLMPTLDPATTTQRQPPYYREDSAAADNSSSEELAGPVQPPPPGTNTTESSDNETTTETSSYESTTVTETVSTVDTPPEEVTTTAPVFPPIIPTRPPQPPIIPTIPPTTPTPTRPPPDVQLQNVIDEIETMLQEESPVLVEDIDGAFDQVDDLLNTTVTDNLDFGELLHLLDQLSSKVYLNGSNCASAIRPNIAMLMGDADPSNPIRGMRIASRNNDEFTVDAFQIISEEVNSTHLASNENEAVVQLPESVASSTRRISFVVFRTDRAFRNNPDHEAHAVNSRVLSINVENLTQFEPGEVIDIHLSSMAGDPERNMSRACAYWHFFDDGTGYWSQEGCTFIRSRAGVLDTCRCDHLTHFAEILVPRTVFSQRNEDVLEVLTIIGCCLSIFGLLLIGLTAAMFRSWRRDFSNKIWLQLCISIFILVLCFLIIVFAKFDYYDIPCMLIGVALHYSVLSSFCWMLVAAILSYRRLVIVFTRDASHKLLRASAFSWGAPCAVVGILLSVDPHSYAGRFEDLTPSGAFCYPSGLGLWLTVYAPIALMLLANWILFALIVRSVFASRRIQRHGDSNEALRCASVSCLLVFLFGLPWIFGLFAYNVVLAYLFTLTATFQGFVLFIFFVLGNKKTRDLWLNKLKIRQTRKIPVTSSTYTNRSTGPGYRAGPVGAPSIEVNSSKPKSLSSSDNSRFS